MSLERFLSFINSEPAKADIRDCKTLIRLFGNWLNHEYFKSSDIRYIEFSPFFVIPLAQLNPEVEKELIQTVTSKDWHNLEDYENLYNSSHDYAFAFPGRSGWIDAALILSSYDGKRISDFNDLCRMMRDLQEFYTHIQDQTRESNHEYFSEIIGQINHDLNSLITLSDFNEISDPELELKIRYFSDMLTGLVLLTREPELYRATVSVNDLIAGILKNITGYPKVSSQFVISDDIGQFDPDVEFISMALSRILDNAFRAADLTGGFVEINVSASSSSILGRTYEWLHFSISDTGPGIPDEFLVKIKDPFFSTFRNQGHSGLGLTIADRIIEAHGGSLYISNRKKGGVIADVYLPVEK